MEMLAWPRRSLTTLGWTPRFINTVACVWRRPCSGMRGTPARAIEHDVANVRRAAADLRVTYPIAVDSDYAVWNAFDNHYWPALYIADAQGRLRHHHFGEGAYDRTE